MEKQNIEEIIRKKVEYEDSCPLGRLRRAGYLAFAYAINGRKDCLETMQQLKYIRTIPSESDAEAYFRHSNREKECRTKIDYLYKIPSNQNDNLRYHEIRMLKKERDEASEHQEILINRIAQVGDFIY